MSHYNVYIIYSNWSIETMTQFLLQILPNSVGLMKIVYDCNQNETNKTIAVLSADLYDILIQRGYGQSRFEIDFRIKQYHFNDQLLPKNGCSNSLFVPIIKQMTELTVTQAIQSKLTIFANFGIIPHCSWRLTCPIHSRETGVVKLGCFIFFKEVSTHQIGIVKFLLNNTYWTDDVSNTKYDNIIKCHWARPRAS